MSISPCLLLPFPLLLNQKKQQPLYGISHFLPQDAAPSNGESNLPGATEKSHLQRVNPSLDQSFWLILVGNLLYQNRKYMSSHHFVKEQQEPALLIVDTANHHYSQIAPLLEWVPTVLVAQQAVDEVLSWGIKIDIILAEEAFQKQNMELLEEQFPLKFLTVMEGNFLTEGLQYLIATKHTAANIVGFAHQNTTALESLLPFLNLVVFDGPIRYFPVRDNVFKKWFPSSSVQLHAPDGAVIEMKRDQDSQLIPIQHATFVTIEEGIVTFQSNQLFWIGEMVANELDG